jgi:tetratricopeptide (TPR) repeat protein
MAYNTGELATARLWVEEALTLHRKLGEAWGAAYSGFMLGNIVDQQGDHARALELYEDSRRAFRELGEEYYMLVAVSNAAWVYEQLGDHERSRALNQEKVGRVRALHF